MNSWFTSTSAGCVTSAVVFIVCAGIAYGVAAIICNL